MDTDDDVYVVIGDDTMDEDDTDTETGAQITATIHVWAKKLGRIEVKEVQSEIDGLLHRQDLEVDDFTVVGINREFSQTFDDPDGVTRHGVQRYRMLMEAI